ncbi:hypothetical protein FPV67DRAFT_74416 [Lyophyllum atratum]|nr:hypothetical protein FPV67DRAFT_74416 [Lyophyllum atratum]
MVNVRQAVFSFLGLRLPYHHAAQSHDVKSIAIVGAGSARLATLKTLFDLPESTRSSLEVVLFERRHNLGGIWLPDPDPALPPVVPETPLYSSLHSNTSVPSMSFPQFPFTKSSPLYPPHEYVASIPCAVRLPLQFVPPHSLQPRGLQDVMDGATEGRWDIAYRDASGSPRHRSFDHLIVTTGNNHVPRISVWQGQRDWLEKSQRQSPKREIMHSVWYRGPERYATRRVLVVGTGSSGRDAAPQVVPYAKETFVSMRHEPDPVLGPLTAGAHPKPDISRFTADRVVFQDGTTADVDAILLAAGYEIRKPFLETSHVLVTDRQARSNDSYSGQLVTNTHYIFPLHQHIFSLSPSYPVSALAFIGLPSPIVPRISPKRCSLRMPFLTARCFLLGMSCCKIWICAKTPCARPDMTHTASDTDYQ